MGWFTVFAYGVATVLAIAAAKAVRADADERGGRVGRVWIGVAVLLGFLLMNKQLDLQSLFTDIGRVLSKSEGWYAERRSVQKVFVRGLLVGSTALFCWSLWGFRRFWRSHGLLIAGLLFLLTFIVVRAVSFHHVDEFLGTRVFGMKMNWVLELTGIGLVATAGALETRKQGRFRNGTGGR